MKYVLSSVELEYNILESNKYRECLKKLNYEKIEIKNDSHRKSVIVLEVENVFEVFKAFDGYPIIVETAWNLEMTDENGDDFPRLEIYDYYRE